MIDANSMQGQAENQRVEAASITRIEAWAVWTAVLMASVTLALLLSLHVLSPEFDPSWRVISEYAFGHHAAVLSLMFLCWGISSWALAIPLQRLIRTTKGRVGAWFLTLAGVGEAMASVFDAGQPVGHGIAGLLGVVGFQLLQSWLVVS